ncbi:MAG TPA: hypothetical protein VED24_00615 [Candidatus Acidoferrum sp.]|nr:hypothetical protein [Candidatus Acidoferrum sp.]
MAEVAQRRKRDMERSLETEFERARSIIERETTPAHAIQALELPPDLKARIKAIRDPEKRIRAIVEFKMSTKKRSSDHE